MRSHVKRPSLQRFSGQAPHFSTLRSPNELGCSFLYNVALNLLETSSTVHTDE